MDFPRAPGSNDGGRGRPILGGNMDPNKSTLNVGAAEFVPRFVPMAAPVAPAPIRHQQQYQQAMYQDYQQQPVQQQQQPSSNSYIFKMGTAMDRLKKAINIMTDNPDKYTELIQPLTESLNTVIHNEETLNSMVEAIVWNSMREANFRYTGARMCQYFIHNLKVEFPSGNFRNYLLKRCQEEHVQREELIKSHNSREGLIGFTLFMGELLLNVTLQENQRMKVLINAIHELVWTFLNYEDITGKCLRCAGQVLKLTGAIIEDNEKEETGKSERLDQLFSQIKLLLLDEKIVRSVKNMLLHVVELRASDWGRMEPEHPPPPMPAMPGMHAAVNGAFTPQQPQQQMPQLPYMYTEGMVYNGTEYVYPEAQYWPGEDEQSYTEEDQQFYDMYMGPEGDYPTYAQDDEFNDEISAAFEQFMLENQQQNNSHAPPANNQYHNFPYGGGHR